MSRSHYRTAEILRLLQDQEYLRCVKESEEGQTVLCRAPSAPKVLRCKKSKKWKKLQDGKGLIACQKHPLLPLGNRRGHFIYLFVRFNRKLESTFLSAALAVHLLVLFSETQSCFTQKNRMKLREFCWGCQEPALYFHEKRNKRF